MSTNTNKHLDWAESLALIYLVAPLLIFFSSFIRVEIAIPACLCIALQMFSILRKTCWRGLFLNYKEHFFLLAIAILWVWLSGGVGGINQNSDWIKHYSIINFLTQHSWPATAYIEGIGESVIRYSIGWYLVPSLVIKILDTHAQTLALMVWSVLGLFIFFNLLCNIAGRHKWSILIPVVFIIFGGADSIGTILTGYSHGPIYHMEWWASWIEFPANTTSIFWVPQHAIPAWIGVAYLLIAREKPVLTEFIFLLGIAVFLWSPFSAVGLVPFAFLLLLKNGFRNSVFNWRAIVLILLLGFPLIIYMVSKSESIPNGLITTIPCLWDDGSCFTWPSYFLFILLEVGFFILLLFMAKIKEKDFLILAALSLLLIPLYRLGINNDFAMRASLPALAVLAIFVGKTLISGPRRYSIAIVLLLILALPTTLGEAYRGFLPGGISTDATFTDPWAKKYLRQYFAPLPIWIIKG